MDRALILTFYVTFVNFFGNPVGVLHTNIEITELFVHENGLSKVEKLTG